MGASKRVVVEELQLGRFLCKRLNNKISVPLIPLVGTAGAFIRLI